MNKKPPDWAEPNPGPECNVWVRMVFMKANEEIARILKSQHNLTKSQETVMDDILTWWMEKGEGQNVSSLANGAVGSRHLAEKAVEGLIAKRMIHMVNGRYIPAVEFIQGSRTSAPVLRVLLKAADDAAKMLQEARDNTSEHQKREQVLAERLAKVNSLIDQDR